jgi:hypothetical protein
LGLIEEVDPLLGATDVGRQRPLVMLGPVVIKTVTETDNLSVDVPEPILANFESVEENLSADPAVSSISNILIDSCN